jgi:hypothetical protein
MASLTLTLTKQVCLKGLSLTGMNDYSAQRGSAPLHMQVVTRTNCYSEFFKATSEISQKSPHGEYHARTTGCCLGIPCQVSISKHIR